MKHFFFALMLLLAGGTMAAQSLEAVLDGTTETTCPNTSDGAIAISVTGGTAPYTFLWSNGSTDEDLSGIPPGNYSVIVSDAGGTSDTLSDILLEWVNLLPAVWAEGGTLTCAEPEIQLNSIYTAYNAAVLWTGPGGFTSTDSLPTVNEAGDYLLAVVDTISGCAASTTASVLLNDTPPEANATGSTLTCLAGSVQIFGSSMPPTVSFDWTGPGGFGTDEQNPTVDQPGDYVLTVIDTLNGCSSTATATVLEDLEIPTGFSAGADIHNDCVNQNWNLLGTIDDLLQSASWSGPNGFASADPAAPFVEAGDYILTVTDLTSGCTATDATTVSIDTIAPGAAAVGGNITCVQSVVEITASSPTTGVDFEWTTNGGIFSTDATTTVDQPGDYAVIVTNPANGCTSTASAHVEDLSTPPVASAGPDAVLNCFNTLLALDGSGSTGIGTITVWTTADGHIVDSDSTLYPTIDAAGTYVLTVFDPVSQCSATDTAVVTQNAPVTASIVAIQNVSCHGGADGYLEAEATGGTGSYFFGWSNGSQDYSASNLIAGDWHLTVVDGDGCTAVAGATLVEPDPIFVNTGAENVTSTGATDGIAWAAPTGGTAPYEFNWSTGETSDSIFNLPAAPVVVYVKDALGCSVIGIANVQEFGCSLTASISSNNILCYGSLDGAATATPLGGEEPFSFLWSNGETTASVNDLEPGDHLVQITDGAGCVAAYPVHISQPEQELQAGFIFVQNVGCPEFAEGSLTAWVNGGTQAYDYSWSNGAAAETVDGLSVGNYSLVVTDAHGCSVETIAAITSADVAPPVLALKDIFLELDANGTVEVFAGYFDDGSYDADCSIQTWTISPTSFDCTQTGPQTVTITAADGSGNISTGTATAFVEDNIAPTITCPASVVVGECKATQDYAAPEVADNCAGGSLTQLLGLPSGSTFPVGVTVNSFKFTDASGNEAVCTFTVHVVEAGSISAVSLDELCHGSCDGTAKAFIAGGFEPHTFLWSNGATSDKADELCAGNYTVTATDAGGCTLTTTATIASPNLLTVNVLETQNPGCPNALTGFVHLAAAGGTGSLNIDWSNGATGLSLENVAAGTYSATVTDQNGCTATTSATLTGFDIEPPTVVLNGQVTVPLDNSGQVVLTAALFDAGSFDNCGIASWTVSPASFDCDSLGERIVTVTATDFGGNSQSALSTVTVIDKKAPTLSCNSPITVGACQAGEVHYAQPIVFDNCPINTDLIKLESGLPSGSAFPAGTTTQLFSYTDASGNIGSCSFDITVKEAATATATVTEPKCSNSCDGSIAFAFGGNSGPFTVGGPVNDLCAGSYTHTITDSYGCSSLVSTVVGAPPAIELTVNSFVDETDGKANGSISVTVTGGTPPYSYQWDKDGLPFASGSPVLTGLKAGNYHVLVIDGNGCNYNSVVITINNIVATSEPMWASGLRLSPNPASEAVRLLFSDEIGEKLAVEVFDAAGRLLKTADVSAGETIDVTSLPAGVWQLRISRGDGSRAVRKLVVAH